MSVIFKALTRLERQSVAADTAPAKDCPHRLSPRRRWYAAVFLVAMGCGSSLVFFYQLPAWPGKPMVMEAAATEAAGGPAASFVERGFQTEVVFQPAKAVLPAGRKAASAGRKQAAGAEASKKKAKSRPLVVAKVTPKAGLPVARAATVKVMSQKVTVKKDKSASNLMAKLVRQRKQAAALVTDIRNAMARKDFATADLLLQRLTALKGDASYLVLQLRAYRMIQAGRWQEAEALLQQVLEAYPDDRQAALNLAVVQIKSGRIRQARRCLEQLYRRFPEDDRIGQWLELLQR